MKPNGTLAGCYICKEFAKSKCKQKDPKGGKNNETNIEYDSGGSYSM